MRRVMMVFPLAGLMCGAVSASSDSRDARYAREDARLEKALAGKVAGKPQTCIRLRDTQGTEGFDNKDGTILFKVSRKLVYRNDTLGGCRDFARNGRALITRTFGGGDLCRGDIATSADLQAGFESGSCAMGDFVPYRVADIR